MAEEFELMGENFANRGRRAVEMVKLMRQLWTGETVDFKGEFYQVSGCKMHPTPVQKTIPVVWGGHSDAAIRRVAQVGDGWHPTQITLEELEAGVKKLRQYCQEYGRDPASTLVIARPGDKYDITPETHAKHLELGIDHLVVDTPIKQEDPDLSLLHEKIVRAAEVCGLTPRK
jgi:alkanesulfonate monooxygenase SsuD/methylene tetrahydromethanopterin reductase-like flavin-dependent oxidoreductase (luciferase family)